MSLQMNEVITRNQEYAPPRYEEIIGIPMWSVNTAPPTEHPGTECIQPPAYDTLPDIPIWTIPLPGPHMSLSDQESDVESQIPSYSATSSPEPPQYNLNTTSIRRPNAVLPQTSEMPLFRYSGCKSPPAIVGVWLLIAGFVQVGAGTVLAFSRFAKYSYTLTYGLPFWAPVCFLLTGGLSITAHCKPFICQVRILLCSNLITIIVSSIGLVLNMKDLENLRDMMLHDPSITNSYRGDFNIHYALIGTNVALLCFSVCASIFGLSVLCRLSRKDPQESVTENDFTPPRTSSDLHETPLPSPPPYTVQRVNISRITQ